MKISKAISKAYRTRQKRYTRLLKRMAKQINDLLTKEERRKRK